MSNSEFLRDIINDFEVSKFTRFFREKSNKFAPRQENFSQYNDDDFKDGKKLGEIKFAEAEQLAVFAFQARQPLSERSGKKAQYEKGKRILKDRQYDAGIFIYYNQTGNFRFSLIYANYLGKRRDWSVFRRFTYFVSKEFTNKTFKQRIGEGDFSSLEKIKDAFSVEKVTKDFYESIANWYFWAVKYSIFPKDAEAEKDGRNIAVIRLITRMIFIWFMRERGLVPKDLFEEKNIASILKSISAEDSTYYTGILQNLFFATLSTKKEERQFGSEIRGYKGYNPDFGNQYVFRYQELFKNPDEIKKYFGDIPFLNGGLFECLDDKRNGIIIDGFSRTKKNQPVVPNFLFFSQEKKADLNKAYGTKNKTYKVRGLLNILSSFNFTIDENSPDDADIALDPELLGRVFENLLASFNPETSTTARKATGSYYTPREIVDYMVAESLKAYFKTHLEEVENIDEKIENLFSTGSQENHFNKEQSKKIVELIESVKIVDPAVGSGAFPMGALNKLVFILNKVDPGNELWKQAQLSAADAIPDPRIKQDNKNRIEEFFKGKNADYGRKLYLIQKCIYGVDIQQIAVEISKLRFFISLLVDEGIDKAKENWGIEPLPNLDFKIMQGNSLLEEYEGVKLFDEKLLSQTSKQEIIDKINEIDSQLKENDSQRLKLYEKNPDWMKNKKIEKPAELLTLENNKKVLDGKKATLTDELKSFELASQQNELGLYGQSRAKSLGDELKRLHKEFFETNEKETKGEIKKQIEKMEWDLIEATLKENGKEAELKNLEKFKKSKTRPFFLWQLNFPEVFEKGGFDIVIANPPYGGKLTESEKELLKRIFYKDGTGNTASFFIFKGLSLLKNNGCISYIVPKQLTYISSWKGTRKFLLSEQFTHLIDVSEAFQNVELEQVIFVCLKQKNTGEEIKVGFSNNNIIEENISFGKYFTEERFPIWITEKNYGIFDKMLGNSTPLIRIAKVNWGGPVAKYLSKRNRSDSIKCLRGREISRYHMYPKHYIRKTNLVLSYYIKGEKIVLQRIVSRCGKIIYANYRDARIAGTYSNNNIYTDKTVTMIWDSSVNLKYILALLNSRLISWFAHRYLYNRSQLTMEFMYEYARNFPLRIADVKDQNFFIEKVDKILAITKDGDYLEDPEKQAKVKEYEKQIDQMVYKLYGLTPEEIKIVEDN